MFLVYHPICVHCVSLQWKFCEKRAGCILNRMYFNQIFLEFEQNANTVFFNNFNFIFREFFWEL